MVGGERGKQFWGFDLTLLRRRNRWASPKGWEESRCAGQLHMQATKPCIRLDLHACARPFHPENPVRLLWAVVSYGSSIAKTFFSFFFEKTESARISARLNADHAIMHSGTRIIYIKGLNAEDEQSSILWTSLSVRKVTVQTKCYSIYAMVQLLFCAAKSDIVLHCRIVSLWQLLCVW